jgi:hypothetical protein
VRLVADLGVGGDRRGDHRHAVAAEQVSDEGDAAEVVEAEALLAELRRRRGRSIWQLENAVTECQGRLAAGQRPEALVALLGVARNQAMVQLKPNERVIGQGKPLGTLYRLDDGRTILVRKPR